jgi:hypothetical protein
MPKAVVVHVWVQLNRNRKKAAGYEGAPAGTDVGGRV